MASVGIVCLLLYANLHAAHCDTYNEYLATTLPDLCPYSTFCTMGPSKQFTNKHYSPCCKPCSCNDDCQLYGNCCPDASGSAHRDSPNTPPTAKCSAPAHYVSDGFKNQLARQHLNLGFYFHYITSTCPVGYSDHEIINKCLNVSMQDLWDNVIVSDSTGRAFFNQYCAKCNGVHTYTRWDLRLTCRVLNHVPMDIQNIQTLNDNSCLILSSPPSTDIALKSRCFPIDYDTCNTTGIWKMHDSNLERACAASTYPYVTLFRSTVTYKNIYCYLCNRADDIAITDTCQSDKVSDGTKTGGLTKFSALLAAPTTTKRTNCKRSEIYDYHLKTCHTLFCPMSLLPQNGMCTSVFRETNRMSIFAQIEAKYADQDTPTEVQWLLSQHYIAYTNHLESIASHLLTSFGIDKYSCRPCRSMAAVRKDNSSITFNLGFTTSRQCPASRITDLINIWRLQPNEFQIKIGEHRFAFNPELAYRQDTLLFSDRFIRDVRMFTHQYVACNDNISGKWLRPKFYCANVELPPSDYTNILSSKSSQVHPSDFTAISNVTDPGNSTIGYKICVNKYLPYSNVGVSEKSSPVGRICMATMVVMLIVN